MMNDILVAGFLGIVLIACVIVVIKDIKAQKELVKDEEKEKMAMLMKETNEKKPS